MLIAFNRRLSLARATLKLDFRFADGQHYTIPANAFASSASPPNA
jgi:hypothetical protein